MIEGVVVQKLKQIVDDRGSVMHMLRVDDPIFEKFGEIYFSEILPGVVKAWKRHKKMTQHFAALVGKIRIVLFDDRDGSRTQGKICEYVLGRPDYYFLLRIPPKLWYGFTCISESPAILANCTDIPHDPEESERAPVADPRLPYDWNKAKG